MGKANIFAPVERIMVASQVIILFLKLTTKRENNPVSGTKVGVCVCVCCSPNLGITKG